LSAPGKLPQCNYDKYGAPASTLTAWFKNPEAAAAGVETFSTQKIARSFYFSSCPLLGITGSITGN